MPSNAVGQLAFFNVFQAYPERAPDTDGRVRPAIEDNLTRALALPLQVVGPAAVAKFLDRLDLSRAARVLRGCQSFDVGMQGQAEPKEGDEVLLVSLAAESGQPWTTGTRRRAEVPRFDAWLQAPGILVVFEAKSSDGRPDATQLADYASRLLGLEPMDLGGVSLPPWGGCLSPDDVPLVQDALLSAYRVEERTWVQVRSTLESLEPSDPVARKLVGDAAVYLAANELVDGDTLAAILQHASGSRTPRRISWGRRLVRNFGARLHEELVGRGAGGLRRKDGEVELGLGTDSDAFVRVDGQQVRVPAGLGGRPGLVFWFDLAGEPRFGLEVYVQASSAALGWKGLKEAGPVANDWADHWAATRLKHLGEKRTAWRSALEILWRRWDAPAGASVTVSAVGFNGANTNWQGAVPAGDVPSLKLDPTGELPEDGAFDPFWTWPEWPGNPSPSKEEVLALVGRVRKPAVALVAPAMLPEGADVAEVAEWIQSAGTGLLDLGG